ncbi:SLBB domain-containing protein [Phyllobacterium sp. 0TCS1.6C]|uniref:SLBB domain-containing protein n=1 Tax=unclassified Phyllobacterium TaxID=2638441 RepID=UPI002264948E|nr:MULTISPECIES: SLBB domain-containing protein [unclassified Phyllobacterium]MCX8279969.1 SLBB domain-containing protein [Phyllobacterium sp. 0TCS1.6C]MCX8296136.1 SLBB domain-containing protein [Phyllobacterium sp. 0TCS1.6A]
MWHELKRSILGIARRLMLAAALCSIPFAMPLPAAASEPYKLAPYTRLRLTVLEWVAARGEYREWSALNGEYVVSEEGSLLLPLVGTMEVSSFDAVTMATEVSKRVQKITGLVNLPNVAVQIVDYPPVFLVGNVERPGEYRFRPGLTVLQAVALAGGRYRPREEARTVEQIQYLGELQSAHGEMVRTLARIARLRAEISGQKDIEFPANLNELADEATVSSIIAEERAVFQAQSNGLTQQLENLSELRRLFASEIDVLQEKVVGQEKQLKLLDDELAAVKPLVERGIATTSRQSDLQRIITALQADRLDQVTAIMRARQNISQASRDAQNLVSTRQTTASTELQTAQASLDQLKIRQETAQRLLVAAGSIISGQKRGEKQEPDLTFTITRKASAEPVEIAADENTLLVPGDVVRASLNVRFSAQTAGTAAMVPQNSGAAPLAAATGLTNTQ